MADEDMDELQDAQVEAEFGEPVGGSTSAGEQLQEKQQQVQADMDQPVSAEGAKQGEDMRGEAMKAIASEPRQDAAAGAPLRSDTLHVHGVAELSTRQVIAYFKGFAPTAVEWITNSSCNVSFDSAFSCKRALLGLGKKEKTKQGAPLSEAPWHTGRTLSSGRISTLSFRMATVVDTRSLRTEILRNLGKRDLAGGGAAGEGVGAPPPSTARADNGKRPLAGAVAGWGGPAIGVPFGSSYAVLSGAGRQVKDLDAPEAESARAEEDGVVVGLQGEDAEGADLRDLLRSRGRERVEEDDDDGAPGGDDLRRVLEDQRRAKRRALLHKRLGPASAGAQIGPDESGKGASGGGASSAGRVVGATGLVSRSRLFLQSVSQLETVAPGAKD